MRNYKKYLVAVLAMTMVAGSSVMAAAPGKDYVSSNNVTISDSNAANGSIGGNGSVEGTASKDVFTVEVPTCMTENNTDFDGFAFVLDPEKLITATEASRYTTGSNAVAEKFVKDKTLYFINKTSKTIDDTSDYIKVTNKSSIDVDIKLDAEVTGATDIPMSAKKDFSEDTTTSMYLALKDDGGEYPIVKDTSNNKNTVSVTNTISAAPEEAYSVVETNGKYEYTLKEGDWSFDTYEFALTGASNNNADWSGLDASANNPNVVITWDITPSPDPVVPSIATKEYTYADTDIAITVDLGAGAQLAKGIKSITFNANGTTKTLVAGTDYTFAGTTLTLKDSKLSGMTVSNPVFTITFDNAASTKVEVKVLK